jgi:hypothetical protein
MAKVWGAKAGPCRPRTDPIAAFAPAPLMPLTGPRCPPGHRRALLIRTRLIAILPEQSSLMKRRPSYAELPMAFYKRQSYGHATVPGPTTSGKEPARAGPHQNQPLERPCRMS